MNIPKLNPQIAEITILNSDVKRLILDAVKNIEGFENLENDAEITFDIKDGIFGHVKVKTYTFKPKQSEK